MIQELRRGNEFATVYCVTFDPAGLWLSVSSDSCNVHIFALKLTEDEVLMPSHSEKREVLAKCIPSLTGEPQKQTVLHAQPDPLLRQRSQLQLLQDPQLRNRDDN